MVVDSGVRGAIYHTALDDGQATSVALTAPVLCQKSVCLFELKLGQDR